MSSESLTARSTSVVLLFLTLLVPIATYALEQKPAYTVPSCPSQQKPFVIQTYRGTYIDLVRQGISACGFVPEVCLGDFEKNNIEKSIDDFYQHMVLYAENNEGTVRIIPSLDLVQDKFHYFYVSQDHLPGDSSFGLLQGCATEVETKNQSIYQVESIVPSPE